MIGDICGDYLMLGDQNSLFCSVGKYLSWAKPAFTSNKSIDLEIAECDKQESEDAMFRIKQSPIVHVKTGKILFKTVAGYGLIQTV